ncbi:MAG: hypothetical protein LUP94_02495 [Candidatus Methanomethylicus sp.]|nr:hypothetical protein [Candidatus Methanomethylicus sp.]
MDIESLMPYMMPLIVAFSLAIASGVLAILFMDYLRFQKETRAKKARQKNGTPASPLTDVEELRAWGLEPEDVQGIPTVSGSGMKLSDRKTLADLLFRWTRGKKRRLPSLGIQVKSPQKGAPAPTAKKEPETLRLSAGEPPLVARSSPKADGKQEMVINDDKLMETMFQWTVQNAKPKVTILDAPNAGGMGSSTLSQNGTLSEASSESKTRVPMPLRGDVISESILEKRTEPESIAPEELDQPSKKAGDEDAEPGEPKIKVKPLCSLEEAKKIIAKKAQMEKEAEAKTQESGEDIQVSLVKLEEVVKELQKPPKAVPKTAEPKKAEPIPSPKSADATVTADAEITNLEIKAKPQPKATPLEEAIKELDQPEPAKAVSAQETQATTPAPEVLPAVKPAVAKPARNEDDFNQQISDLRDSVQALNSTLKKMKAKQDSHKSGN